MGSVFYYGQQGKIRPENELGQNSSKITQIYKKGMAVVKRRNSVNFPSLFYLRIFCGVLTSTAVFAWSNFFSKCGIQKQILI